MATGKRAGTAASKVMRDPKATRRRSERPRLTSHRGRAHPRMASPPKRSNSVALAAEAGPTETRNLL